jgi:hypothetical protein
MRFRVTPSSSSSGWCWISPWSALSLATALIATTSCAPAVEPQTVAELPVAATRPPAAAPPQPGIDGTTRGLSLQSDDPAAARAHAVKRYARRIAVTVGVNNYDTLPKLGAAVDDARRTAELFKSAGFDLVQSLADADATQAGILSLLEERIAPQTGPDDLVVVFFAGHGVTLDDMGYVLPRDARKEAIAQTAISVQRLKESALRMKARHVVFLVDACFSGSMFKKPGNAADGGLKYWQATADDRVVEIITAGSAREEVLEFDGWGAFTRRVHAGLNGAADRDHDSVVTGLELSRYVEEAVVTDTHGAQHPQWGNVEGTGTVLFWDARLGGNAAHAERLSRGLLLPKQQPKLDQIQQLLDRKQWAAAEPLLRSLSLEATDTAVVSLLLAEVYVELDASSNVQLIQRELDRAERATLSDLERRILLDLRERLQKAERGPL